MLLGIRQVGDLLAGQPDDIAGLGNIVLEGSQRLGVFVRRGGR